MTALALPLAGCTPLSESDTAEPLTIAVQLNQGSGPDDIHLAGLELRLEHLNQLRTQQDLPPLVLEVHGGGPANVGSEIIKLADLPNVVAAISGSCADCVLDNLDRIEAAGLPTITLAAGSELVTPVAERRYIFQLAPEPSGIADVLARTIADQNDGAVVAVITSDDRYGADGARQLAEALPVFNLDTAFLETVQAVDQAEEIADQIISWQPPPPEDQFAAPDDRQVDSVVLWTTEEQAHAIALELRAQGFEGQLYLESSASQQTFVSGAAADALSGAILVGSPVLVADQRIATNPGLIARQQWVSSSRLSQLDHHTAASYAADALELIHTATMVTTDREGVRRELENTRKPGFVADIAFSPGNHNGLDSGAFVILRLSGDRWVLTS